jgi:hypothetical protein
MRSHVKLKATAVLLAIGQVAVTCGEMPEPLDLGSLLGKPIASQELQEFIKTNHLVQQPTAMDGYTICQSTNSPFILNCRSNLVWVVSLPLVPTEMVPGKTLPRYTGRLVYGLTPDDTIKTVTQRLGAPSSRRDHRATVSLLYEKLRLELDFDEKTGSLKYVSWRDDL